MNETNTTIMENINWLKSKLSIGSSSSPDYTLKSELLRNINCIIKKHKKTNNLT